MDAFFILTGCWSSKEVEELSLTAGIALDKGKNSTIEKKMRKEVILKEIL